jgi:CRP-like cAMP-binding protein
MNKKQIAAFKKIPLFEGFSAKGLKKFLSTFKYIHHKKDDIIFKEFAKEDSFYIIASGEVSIEKKSNGKRFKKLAILKENDFFGEMAVIEQQPRFAQARALKETELFELDRNSLMGFIKVCPEDGSYLLIEIVRIILKRLKHTSDELITAQGFLEVLAKHKRN